MEGLSGQMEICSDIGIGTNISIGTKGFGIIFVISPSLDPEPPARIIAFINLLSVNVFF